MVKLNDQLGREVLLDAPPQKIVSLVPSQTELLSYFGLENETVGITKFCIYPDVWFKTKNRVGGTKNLDLDKIRELQPDLIIANKEENTQAEIEALASEFQVYISDIVSIQDAFDMIKDLGSLCNREQAAVDLLDELHEDIETLPSYSGKVAYFIWKEPYMACGQDNFINSMIEKLGFENILKESRYHELSANQIKLLDVDYIFLSTEPYPFNEKHLQEFAALSDAKIVIVDGEMFSWYGSRMLEMKAYFQGLLG